MSQVRVFTHPAEAHGLSLLAHEQIAPGQALLCRPLANDGITSAYEAGSVADLVSQLASDIASGTLCCLTANIDGETVSILFTP